MPGSLSRHPTRMGATTVKSFNIDDVVKAKEAIKARSDQQLKRMHNQLVRGDSEYEAWHKHKLDVEACLNGVMRGIQLGKKK